MKNYTKNEIEEMQRQAIERVREMQRRANKTLGQANLDLGREVTSEKNTKNEESAASHESKTNEKQEQIKQTGKNIKIPDSPRRISLPIEFAEDRPRKNTSYSEQANTDEKKQIDKKGFLENIDSDKALILALILLLSSEGADLELILALLYIMY